MIAVKIETTSSTIELEALCNYLNFIHNSLRVKRFVAVNPFEQLTSHHYIAAIVQQVLLGRGGFAAVVRPIQRLLLGHRA